MSNAWDDFQGPSKEPQASEAKAKQVETGDERACDWGFSGQEEQVGGELAGGESDSAKFIPVYERYLRDKQSFINNKDTTKNHSLYESNPQKAIKEWFDNEGHESFSIHTEQPRDNQYICSLDLPIDDQDFSLTSEMHHKKQDAIDEICLAACKMLDGCQLLYSWHSAVTDTKEDPEKKRRLDEANKEDDIELDNTKRHCKTSSKLTVNTYESLMAKWKDLNMSILQLKAKLVKLDLSVKQLHLKKDDVKGEDEDKGEEEEIDPLDEFMSSLENKSKLSMDEKIEKSRLKSQIAAYESEQSEVSRFIELAKPKFDLDKATKRR